MQIDVACVGIGENGHSAFNDPPADFETREPYLVVELDEACRKQQLGEGWFPTLEAVPWRAISMSIRQIMKSRAIVCTVPDAQGPGGPRLLRPWPGVAGSSRVDSPDAPGLFPAARSTGGVTPAGRPARRVGSPDRTSRLTARASPLRVQCRDLTIHAVRAPYSSSGVVHV